MKNYVWELESNIADLWSFMEKVLAKLLLSQESRFVFLPKESLQVTLMTTKSARVPNILFEIGFLTLSG